MKTSVVLITASAVLALVAIAAMTCSMLSRTPAEVAIANAASMGFGVASLALYLWGVIRDHQQRAGASASAAASPPR